MGVYDHLMKRASCEGDRHFTPDHRAQISRLNRIIGQLNAVKRMIENNEYCPDILTQTSAARSAIKSLEASVLEAHLGHCVKDAFSSSNKREVTMKIEELINLFKRVV